MNINILKSSVALDEWLSQIEANWSDIPELNHGPNKIKHLAVICDGNRRAANNKGLSAQHGHRMGVEVIKGIAKACRQWDIPHATFWTFSTENWQRQGDQVNFLMSLAARYLRDEEAIAEIINNQTRFVHLGRKDRLSRSILTSIKRLEERTAMFNRYYFNLALDYGGVDEVGRAATKIAEAIRRGELAADALTRNPNLIYDYLDTAGQPLPDLVVRTGVHIGDIPHTSGFMPLQTSYAGWSFLPDYFPDLTPHKLALAIDEFYDAQMRFGV
ncbi:MAG: isoprenyl transferase [Candidatus Promineifilaceae bacterium]